MPTSEEYLELSARFGRAKLETQDAATRHQLETFKRSYSLLARSEQVLARSRAIQNALERHK